MATQAQKFKKIKQEAAKSGAKSDVKTAAKIIGAYSDLSASAKKKAMAAIDKVYENLTVDKKEARISTPFKELYARFMKEYRGDKPNAAWKQATSGAGSASRDVVKDAGRPALKKGKRVVKTKGYTSNQYGRWKNKVGTTYYENRSNRFDVNTPIANKKVKLEDGGSIGQAAEGTMTRRRHKKFVMPTQRQIDRMSADELREVFAEWAASEGITDINSPNFEFGYGGRMRMKGC